MSMYRQIWLTVLFSTLLALGGSLLASSLSTRHYLSEQLTLKNTDNALALALSLSQRNPDKTEIDLTVSALFDSGHYELIRVDDPFGKLIAERRSPADAQDIPGWFVSLFDIRSAPGRADISGGWNQIGTVTLVSHSRFAYRALWKSFWEVTGALLLAGLVSGLLGTLVLRRLRRPLDAVIEQAKSITQRRFVTIAEPSVPELRQLAAAMNTTVERLKAMFEEEALRLESVRQEANADPLTGLANRDHFMARLRAALDNDESSGGALLMVRIADLTGVNRRLGRAATDDLLRHVGKAIGDCAGYHPDSIAARLNGADFALLLPDPGPAKATAEGLLTKLVQESAPFIEQGPAAFIGYGSIGNNEDAANLLARVDAALAAAESEAHNGCREAASPSDDDIPRSAEQWARSIQKALDQHWVRLISFPVATLSGTLLHRECPLRLMFDAGGEWLPAGRFLPVAERLKLTPELDLAAVALGLEQLNADAAAPDLAINLSASSIHDPVFRQKLHALLDRQRAAAKRLWLEVTESGALKHLDDFRILRRELSGTGCKLGLEHFGRQFSQIGLLHDLGLDYLKVDASFIRGIESHAGNQAFLKGLASIAHGIGLKVIAEGVVSEAELTMLGELGFDGVTGPAVRDRT